MRLACGALLLLLLIAGCAHGKPDTSVAEPPKVATPSRAPKPPATPAAPATPRSAPAAAPAPRASTPAPQATSKAAPQVASKAAPQVAKTPAVAAAALDLNSLEAQLRETSAIGFFTKITLKNQVDDLLDRFREHHQGKGTLTMTDLRRSYDLLMMKVLSLLQDDDQKLASAIVLSREAIWALLADPKKFATIQG